MSVLVYVTVLTFISLLFSYLIDTDWATEIFSSPLILFGAFSVYTLLIFCVILYIILYEVPQTKENIVVVFFLNGYMHILTLR